VVMQHLLRDLQPQREVQQGGGGEEYVTHSVGVVWCWCGGYGRHVDHRGHERDLAVWCGVVVVWWWCGGGVWWWVGRGGWYTKQANT